MFFNKLKMLFLFIFSTTSFAKGEVVISNVGYLLNEEVNVIKNGDEWYSVENYEGSTSTLKKIKVHISMSEKNACGVLVSKVLPLRESLFIIKGDSIKEGVIPSQFIPEDKKIVLSPYKIHEIIFNNTKIKIGAGMKTRTLKEYKQYPSTIGGDYFMTVTMGTSSAEARLKNNSDQEQKLVWIGDLNKDGIPDILVRGHNTALESRTLFISEKNADGSFKMIDVGSTTTGVDC